MKSRKGGDVSTPLPLIRGFEFEFFGYGVDYFVRERFTPDVGLFGVNLNLVGLQCEKRTPNETLKRKKTKVF